MTPVFSGGESRFGVLLLFWQGAGGAAPLAALVRPATVENQGGLNPGGTGYPCRCGARRGACLLCRLPAPAFSLLSCPLSPRPPSPPGKGEIKVIFVQGAAPLASPRLNPRGTGKWERTTRPAGGVPSLLPAYPAFSLLFCPLSPRPPSPPGKGETKSLFRRGLRPRHPCIRPFAALVNSAGSQGEGGPGEMELSVASDGGV